MKLRSTYESPIYRIERPDDKASGGVRKVRSDVWEITHEKDSETDAAGAANAVSTAIQDQVRDVLSARETEAPYSMECYTSLELPDATIAEISDSFREIFGNTGEHLACQECDKLMGASKIFGVPPETYVPLEQLDALGEKPCCPSCRQPMELLYDPYVTFQQLKKKFLHDAYVTLLRSNKDGHIAGFTFGYERTLREAFDNEWKSRYMYTNRTPEGSLNNYEMFLRNVCPVLSEEVHQDITGSSEIFCWNCCAISPELRGSGALKTLFREFMLQLPRAMVRDRAVLGEAARGSKSHSILLGAGLRPIEVDSDYVVLMGGALRNKYRRWVEGIKKSA